MGKRYDKEENDLRKLVITMSGPGPHDNFGHYECSNEHGDHMDNVKFTLEFGGDGECHGVNFEPDGHGGLIMTRVVDERQHKIMHIPVDWLTSDPKLACERYNRDLGIEAYDKFPSSQSIYIHEGPGGDPDEE